MKKAGQELLAGCTNCGWPMIGAEVVKGTMPCPNCGAFMHVSIKGNNVSVRPVGEGEAVSSLCMRFARSSRYALIS